ncbi:hypothetical protein SAMN06265375_101420 [Muriicola jejuensis]|uniref:Uncharacterized protein n=1 Tax=Muriicola jejuensis TaxID=504488 RepID=A0A6P0UE85_9FLAO|nr:hypothetical protein [Muriicola jejuensis]NER10048.1 hypothetical protein [Muriicola jejuensis]SMP03429.1 hypothetical protein SAMN06265375_101420 [Muriicola jejuensis]
MSDTNQIAQLWIQPLELSIPTITMWNRIEGRPRKDDFDRALKAEIRDPLWMLTKQWQMGEFKGDDAGSPILAKVLIDKRKLDKYQLADFKAQAYHNNIPLEGLVEQMPIPFEMENKMVSLDLRLMIGRHWLKMIKADALLSKKYIAEYPIVAPGNPNAEVDDKILSHPEVWQKFAAVENRKMDGYTFYLFLKKGGTQSDGFDDSALIASHGKVFTDWFDSFFIQPEKGEEHAYLPSRLEYQFKVSTTENGKDKVYKAEEYYSGKLDWFNLSIDEKDVMGNITVPPKIKHQIPERNKNVFSFIPANIDYEGMPDTRWWKFEDRNTYLGDIKTDTTDISKLLFMEFTLLYANDWFLLPQEVTAGNIINLKGLAVTNCFGERTWIEPTGKGKDDDWHRWTMFTIDKKGKDLKEADYSLVMLPTVEKIQEGPALEKIAIIRDELANMVWAIELEVPLASGESKKGTEAARELVSFYERLYKNKVIPQAVGEVDAQIRYEVMNSVPENWIPFIPVKVEGSNRQIQLRRASMPRIIPGMAPTPPIKPRTSLLRFGLDGNKAAYYIHEEEVPRAGIHVFKNYQRTRWYGGKVFKWLGIRKTVGRGEGSSGLSFDRILAKEAKK